MDNILDAPERSELPVLAQVSPFPIAKKYATIFFLLAVASSFAMVTFNLMGNKLIGYAMMIPTLVVFYFAFKEHRENDLQGYLPFSRVVKISWLTGLFLAIPTAIFVYVLYQYIAPNAMEQMVDVVRTEMEKQPGADPELTETIIAMQEKWFLNPPAMAIFMLLGSPITYLLYGMLVGAFMHKAIPKFR
jgi:Protein of unknown function (DUF4199)